MGKFHDDGTLEIGGFGGKEITEESSTVSEMDALEREVKRLKLMIGKEQTERKLHQSRLVHRVNHLSRNYEKSIRIMAISLVAFSILNLALTIARLFI